MFKDITSTDIYEALPNLILAGNLIGVIAAITDDFNIPALGVATAGVTLAVASQISSVITETEKVRRIHLLTMFSSAALATIVLYMSLSESDNAEMQNIITKDITIPTNEAPANIPTLQK